MSQRKKEEERIERIIRSLLKLPENRRCINCNCLGPQYVCTTFWTFVCTSCSGVHREFTHRVKSVSMAKFNAEEINALQAGGNERAREIYFKAWDPLRNAYPDGSNLHRLRDFIKHVYVDRKYTGERGSDKLAMVKVAAKDDFYERRSFERHSFDRSSPSGRVDDRNFRSYIDDGRNPNYRSENGRPGNWRSPSTARFEIVDDRFRDDGYGSGNGSGRQRFSNADSRSTSMSPEPQKIREKINLPLRPLKDILGENSPTIMVGDTPKAKNGKEADGSAHLQKTTSSHSLGSVDEKAVENKITNASSLIDFDMNPEVPDSAAKTQTQTSSSVQSSAMEKASNPSHVNSVESLLYELAIVPVGKAPNGNDAPSATPADASTTNTLASPVREGTAAASPVGNVTDRQQVQTFASPAGDSSSSTAQQGTLALQALCDQPWPSSPTPNASPSPTAQVTAPPHEKSSMPPQNTSYGDGSNSTGRKELLADLFTFSYPSYQAPAQNWQFRPPHGMGYGVQYPPAAMPVAAFPQSAKSTNPFDLYEDSVHVQAAMFPSMASFQGAPPQMSPHVGLQHQPAPFASGLPPQSLPHGIIMSPGAHMGQQLPDSMPDPGQEGNGSFGGGGDAAFASLNPIQRANGGYSTPTSSNSFSPAGGNPFW